MCFNVETGQFNTRSDLSDAPTCALGRGAPLQGLGKCQGKKSQWSWLFVQQIKKMNEWMKIPRYLIVLWNPHLTEMNELQFYSFSVNKLGID